MTTFKGKHSLEKRHTEFKRIHDKYPERIPVIVEKLKSSKSNEELPDLEKKKFLVPRNITFGQFLYIIRSRIQLSPEQALFVFVNNSIIPTTSDTLEIIYSKYKDEDGFLYCGFSGESTLG